MAQVPRHFRGVSWWVQWGDLQKGDASLHDSILRRADEAAAAHADTALIFGTHFRWDFLPYWDLLHEYFHEVAEALHERGIALFDHHSCNCVHRYYTAEQRARGMHAMIGTTPFAPSVEAAATWQFNGECLNDWREIDARTGRVAYNCYLAEQFCPNHPGFRAAYRVYLRRLVSEAGIDGLMCDDINFYGGYRVCACPHCRARLSFKLPAADDAGFWGNWDDPRWREYLAMRRKSVGDFIEHVRDGLPKGFPLMSCCTSGVYGGASYTGQSTHEFLRGDNILNLERTGDSLVNVPLKLTMGGYHEASAARRGAPVFAIGYAFKEGPAGQLWALNQMHGFSTWFSTLKGRLGLPREELAKLPPDAAPIAGAFDFERLHPELFLERPRANCAVYFSERVKNDTCFGNCEQGYTRDFRFLMDALIRGGVMPDTVFDLPSDASEYRVVWMPSVVDLTPTEAAARDRYLAAGGVILSTGPETQDGLARRVEGDFDGLAWLQGQAFPDDAPDEWREERPGLWRNPRRVPADAAVRLKALAPQPVEAPGYAVTLRGGTAHLLACDSELFYDEALEAKRTQHSHVRVIDHAVPRGCADFIATDRPVRAAWCPLGGSASVAEGGVRLDGSPLYVILDFA